MDIIYGYHPWILSIDIIHGNVNDEYVDNHDNDDSTDDVTDDDNDHKKDSYTAAGAAPTQTRPGHAGPSQTPKILYVWLVLA